MAEKILSGLKFIVFLCLIPLGVALTRGFGKELLLLTPAQYSCFIAGICAYVVLHLFIVEPSAVYEYGKGLVSDIFKFLQPLVVVAPLLLPIYSILILILFYFVSLFAKNIDLSAYFLFFTSLTFTMHMVFTAKELHGQDAGGLKSTYFLLMAVIYIVCLTLLALMMSLCFTKFSLPDFFKVTSSVSQDIYGSIFNQLFVPR